MKETMNTVNETVEEVKETVKEEAKEVKKGFKQKIKEIDWKKVGKKVLIGTGIALGCATLVYLVKNSNGTQVVTVNAETGEVLAEAAATVAEAATEAVTQ